MIYFIYSLTGQNENLQYLTQCKNRQTLSLLIASVFNQRNIE